jgi:hypothetical protein
MLSAKPFALEVASRLKPEEDLIFYRSNRQYAHLFYSNGRVVFYNKGRPIQGMSSGDDVGLENRDELALALEQERASGEPSIVVLTPREWQHEVESDKRFGSQVLASQEKTTALRVWLRPRTS